ncbi:MAG: protein translocase subunit SecD [Mycobacteriales bacterium]
MAAPSTHLRATPYFATLAGVLALMYLFVVLGSTHAPKLGLDLRGGTTLTLQARGKVPDRTDLNTARSIIESRVNGRGVTGATVVTEGNNRIVVSVPGGDRSKVRQVGTTAKLYFRPLLLSPAATATATAPPPATPTPTTPTPTGPTTTGPTTGATASKSPAHFSSPRAAPSPTATATGAPTTSATTPNAGTSPAATATAPTATAPTATAPGTPVTVPSGVPASLAADYNKSCAALLKTAQLTPPDKPLISCDGKGPTAQKYVLGPSILAGTQISSAAAQYGAGGSSAIATWTIQLKLKGGGQKIWSDYTSTHNCGGTTCQAATAPAADYVAFALDGKVVSAPGIVSAINGPTEISGGTGGFSADQAKNLADQLKYGALPLSFDTLTETTISPTLGSAQLRAGLLAGGIGLVLVVIYSLIYYRALGLVTIASLLISAALVYASVVLLGNQVGFSLSLAGIAGFIVAVGITADSFVVFFERLKEEVHDGKSMRSGVPRAWVRARRTILSADAVSFLAAAILYYLAAGDVRGFAFTLGLSTILDLIVVFLFTHPLISVASRSRSFSSPRMSGLGRLSRAGTARPALAMATGGAGPAAAVSSAAERAAARRARKPKDS